MCVICISPAGAKQPTFTEIRQMFRKNPDGAGYMVARSGQVHIHKGFMDVEEFLDQLRQEHFTAADSVVYHFRISTQAGIQPTMTHPFPLSNQPGHMKALDVDCRCGVAHNGIIDLTSDPYNHEFSDTALFITDYLSGMIHRPADLRDPQLLNQVYHLAQSKLAIMDGSGYVAKVGQFFNQKGNWYSNLHHQAVPAYSRWQVGYRPAVSF